MGEGHIERMERERERLVKNIYRAEVESNNGREVDQGENRWME